MKGESEMKLAQLCLTLCDPIDGSPPGSPIAGILQARTLEWVAISFSNAWKWKEKVKSLSRVWLLATPWTAAYQASPSMGFSRRALVFSSASVLSSALSLSVQRPSSATSLEDKPLVFFQGERWGDLTSCYTDFQTIFLFLASSSLTFTVTWCFIFLNLSEFWIGISMSMYCFIADLKVKVAQKCSTLCNPMDCTVHGILQTRLLEWVAYSFLQDIFPT